MSNSFHHRDPDACRLVSWALPCEHLTALIYVINLYTVCPAMLQVLYVY